MLWKPSCNVSAAPSECTKQQQLSFGHSFGTSAVLDFQKKIVGPAGPQVFIFCRQNKYSGRQKLYLRINGFSFLKDNGLSLVYVFPKKRVTYLGGQVSDQAWKFGRHCVKAGRIGDPTGRNVEPCSVIG